jgi:hypothetical protein
MNSPDRHCGDFHIAKQYDDLHCAQAKRGSSNVRRKNAEIESLLCCKLSF